MSKLSKEDEIRLRHIVDCYKKMQEEDKRAFTTALDAMALMQRIKEDTK